MIRFVFLIGLHLCILSLSAQVTVELDFNSHRAVSNLIGFNTGFDHRHWVEKESMNGKTTYTDSIRLDVLEPMLDIHAPILRFPGGVIANFYHLYAHNFDCNAVDPCVENFVPGYGLRQQEVSTFNNGFGSVSAEYNFEQNSNNILSNNWIVTFADMLENYELETGEAVEVIYMANVVSHFKFGSQAPQFVGNIPQVESEAFKKSLRETAHALKYLIEDRGVNVTKVEMGTELYFQTWLNNNEVSIDRFIELIPLYRNLLDSLSYTDIELGVPFYHKHDLSANADNWSRKLADQSYHSNMMFDDWIIHDYQRMVEPCDVIFGNCNPCDNWNDDECTLYNGNVNILNCEPDNHSPSSEELENVYEKKNERFSESFNGGLAESYLQILEDLRTLSGKQNSSLWMTEWNEVFDGGCDKWKGINKFFPNSFAHGVNIFEILHSMYEQNGEAENNFMEVASFHTFSAPNIIYAIINARTEVNLNATYYPFQMASLIHQYDLKKVEIKNTNSFDSKALNFHAYSSDMTDSIVHTLVYFSNKTKVALDIDFVNLDSISQKRIRYITADALHSSIDGEYFFKTNNLTVNPINIEFAENEEIVDGDIAIPALSFGYVHFEQQNIIDKSEDLSFDKINIFPNPTLQELTIECLVNKEVEISIYSVLGHVVFNATNNQESIKLDLSDLRDGMYIIAVNTGGHVITKSIMKM